MGGTGIQTVSVPTFDRPTFSRSSAVVPSYEPTARARVPISQTRAALTETSNVQGPNLGKMAIRFSVSNTGEPLNVEGSYIILTDAGKRGLVELAPYKFPVGKIQSDPETTRQLRSRLANQIIQTVRPRVNDTKFNSVEPYEFILTEGKPNKGGTNWVIKYPIIARSDVQKRHYYVIPKIGNRFIENPILI